MWLYRFLRSNEKLFLSITPTMVFLFIILQLSAWYPFLNKAYDEIIYQNKLQSRALNNWHKILLQARRLELATFINDDWVTHKVIAFNEGVPSQWMIEGEASLVTWQALLEQIESLVALSLSSVVWQNQRNGLWFGRLSFDVVAPSKDKSLPYWLPVQSRASHFAKSEWQLLSTLRTNNEVSALLQYKQVTFWVNEGDWLPQVAMTVDHVLFDRLVLVAKNGEKKVLSIGQKEVDTKGN